VFVLNLVCRDKDLKSSVIDKLRDVFQQVYASEIEGEVNTIVYALPVARRAQVVEGEGASCDSVLSDVCDNVKLLDAMVKQKNRTCNVDLTDVTDKLKALHV
jgi:hypothetical protein